MEKENPLVSLVLLCCQYGEQAEVGEILYSIAKQDYRPLELLVCTDELEDSTLDAILERLYFLLKDNEEFSVRVQSFSFEKGLENAINWAISKATGEYIMFHTLSEILYDNKVLSAIEPKMQESQADVAMTRTLLVTKENNQWLVIPDYEKHIKGEISPEQQNGGICFRKSILKHRNKSKEFNSFLRDAISQVKQENVIRIPEICAVRYLCKTLPQTTDQFILYEARSKSLHDEKMPTFQREDRHLNLTDYLTLEAAVHACLRPLWFKKKETTEMIRRVTRRIWYTAQSGSWGLTVSQRSLICYLQELQYAYKEKQKGKIREILTDASQRSEKQFKMAFFANEYAVWPSIQSVYDAAKKHKQMNAQLVYVPFYSQNATIDSDTEMSNYRKAGYDITNCNQYNLTEECPDVAIYTKPYDSIPPQYYIRETHRVIPRCVQFTYGFSMLINNKELFCYHNYLPLAYYAWRIAVSHEEEFREKKKYTFKRGSNLLPCGNPRIDLRIGEYQEEETFLLVKDKAKGRKVILWNTHFPNTENDKGSWDTFGQIGMDILNMFLVSEDVFLLWRPHPLFFGAWAKVQGKSLEEINEWFEKMSQKNNIFVDRTSSYLPAFAVSDAMISDQSSLVMEYWAWKKPLIVTQRTGNDSWLQQFETITFTETAEDVSKFVERVKKQIYESDRIEEELKEAMYIPKKKTVGEYVVDYFNNEIRKETGLLFLLRK